MRDFMVERKRYVFIDKLEIGELLDMPGNVIDYPVKVAVLILQKTIVEPKMTKEEIEKLPMKEFTELVGIMNELYLNKIITQNESWG